MSRTWRNRSSKHTAYDKPGSFIEGLSPKEYFGCKAKASFNYEKEALASARSVEFLPWSLYPYKCRHCKKWHLTSIHPSLHY